MLSFLFMLTLPNSFLPKTIQVVLFSATFDDQVRLYAAKFAPNANEISLKQEELTVEGIRQFYLDCVDDNDKYNVLVKFYGLLTVASSIIFVQVCCSLLSISKFNHANYLSRLAQLLPRLRNA